MKITEYSPASKTSAKKKTSGSSSAASGTDFLGLLSSGDAESAHSAAAPSDMPAIGSMDALLSLQEMPEDEIRKRKAVQESKGTLEALETLRLALLTGSIPEHLLSTLGNVVALQKQRVNDPRLMNIIEDIELRAAVELAKLERASRPAG